MHIRLPVQVRTVGSNKITTNLKSIKSVEETHKLVDYVMAAHKMGGMP